MDTPTPVDVSKLKNILANAKKVMKATDEQFKPKVQSQISESTKGASSINSTPNYSEYDEKEIDYSRFQTQTQGNTITNRDYTIDEVRNSNLPPMIKEAMIKNHIPRVTSLPGAFSLDGLEDLIEKPNQPQKRTINENLYQNNSNMITISRDELNELIDKKINESLAKLFAKTLAEKTIS